MRTLMNTQNRNNPGRSFCIICGSPTRLFLQGLYDTRHGYPGIFDIYRCTYCQFCRTVPALSREQIPDVYSQYYPQRLFTPRMILEKLRENGKRTRWEKWIDGGDTECHTFVKPGSRVLDVGCGNCSSLMKLRETGACEVIGIDVDFTIGQLAKELDLNVHIGQLADLPHKTGTFDYILARQVIEHDPEPDRMLSEMKKRLAPKGTIVLSLPNVNSFYQHLFKSDWLHWHVPYHINHFSGKSISLLAHRCGLSIQDLRTATPTMWTLQQLRQRRITVQNGQRDTYWDPGIPANIPERMTAAERYLPKRFRARWNRWRKVFIRAANQALDASGLGDSFVVALTPKR